LKSSSIARGLLAKVVTGKLSAALQSPYEELRDALPGQSYLGIDETGHKDNGDKLWTWCFRAPAYTLFHIADSRSSDVLIDVLGAAFDGVISCDYFSAYRKFMQDSGAIMQFCLAHLIRDVKFLGDSTDKVTVNWAQKALNDHQHLRSPTPLCLSLPLHRHQRTLRWPLPSIPTAHASVNGYVTRYEDVQIAGNFNSTNSMYCSTYSLRTYGACRFSIHLTISVRTSSMMAARFISRRKVWACRAWSWWEVRSMASSNAAT